MTPPQESDIQAKRTRLLELSQWKTRWGIRIAVYTIAFFGLRAYGAHWAATHAGIGYKELTWTDKMMICYVIAPMKTGHIWFPNPDVYKGN